MTMGLLFWVLMILWIIFWGAWNWQGESFGRIGPVGNSLLLFVLLALLGWGTFGAPIR